MGNLSSLYHKVAGRYPFLLVSLVAGVVILAVTMLRVASLSSQKTAALAQSSPETEGVIRFAVIGDFGKDSTNEARVASLVNSWNPDYIITTGDNNYPDGEAVTIDQNIGKYYQQYIGNYQGAYGIGSPVNRFWPSLGNHDWHTISCSGGNCTGAYFDYFTLPNNERYYDVDLGLVHLFALDSDSGEPDGDNQTSFQAGWLQNQLAVSTSCYDVVYFHHSPYSSGRHGSKTRMQWPFAAWGTDVVMGGHDHDYERLDVGGTPYFVNGAGGASLYPFTNLGNLPSEATSIVRYNEDHGAMLVTATSSGITYQFYTADGVLIDDYTVVKDCSLLSVESPTPTLAPTEGPSPTSTSSESEGTPTPTLTPSPTTTVTTPPSGGVLLFTPTDDTSLYAKSPNNNYGSRTTFEVDGSPVKHILIKFAVTGVGTQEVAGAKLKLYNVNASALGGSFYRVTDNSWNETGVTWNTAPASDGNPIASLGKVVKNRWYEVDLTSYIIGDGIYSIRITSTSGNGADYASKEGSAAFVPQLEITL